MLRKDLCADTAILEAYVKPLQLTNKQSQGLITLINHWIHNAKQGKHASIDIGVSLKQILVDLDSKAMQHCLLGVKTYLQSRDFNCRGKYQTKTWFWGQVISTSESSLLHPFYQGIDILVENLSTSPSCTSSKQSMLPPQASFVQTIGKTIDSTCDYIVEHPLHVLTITLLLFSRLASASEQQSTWKTTALLSQGQEDHHAQLTTCLLNEDPNHISFAFCNMTPYQPSASGSLPNDIALKKTRTRKLNTMQITGSRQTSSNVPDKLNEIKIFKVRQKNNEFITTAARPFEIEQIRSALLKVSNEAAIDSLYQNEVPIMVVPDVYMKSVTQLDDFSASFVMSPYNIILLNEHVFENWGTAAEEQLMTLVANEISHVTIHHHRPQDSKINREDRFKVAVPWTDAAGEKEFKAAYEAFRQSVMEYEKLAEKSESSLKMKMSKTEKDKLARYDAAISTYFTPRYGAGHYNAMQIGLFREDKKITIIKDINNIEPSSSLPLERIKYLRKAFFQELKNKDIDHDTINVGIYTQNQDQIFAERISEFETLSPKMRWVFGPELSESLDNFFKQKYWGERPWWPRK